MKKDEQNVERGSADEETEPTAKTKVFPVVGMWPAGTGNPRLGVPPSPIMTMREVLRYFAISRSVFYVLRDKGLFTTPVKLTERCVGWPRSEVEAIMRARIEGKSDDELREIVRRLHARRHGT